MPYLIMPLQRRPLVSDDRKKIVSASVKKSEKLLLQLYIHIRIRINANKWSK